MAKLSQSYETVMVFSCKNEEAIPALVEKFTTLFVVSGAISEEDAKAVQEKFTTLIAENGKLIAVNEWGKRRLAYPINYETEGYYVLVNFTSAPSFPAELDRHYNITDGVIRSLIVAKAE